VASPTAAQPTGGSGAGTELQALLPDELCGTTVTKYSWTGEAIRRTSEPEPLDIADELGSSVAEMTLAAGLAPPSRCYILIYRYPGVAADQIRTVVDATPGISGGSTAGTISGRDVWITQTTVAYEIGYATSELLFVIVTEDEAEATAVLERMP
jgi:hypothetical protein